MFFPELSAHYYWMFTTRPADCRLFNAVFERLGNCQQSIACLARCYPFGVPPGVAQDGLPENWEYHLGLATDVAATEMNAGMNAGTLDEPSLDGNPGPAVLPTPAETGLRPPVSAASLFFPVPPHP
jgi:hypothetical protein